MLAALVGLWHYLVKERPVRLAVGLNFWHTWGCVDQLHVATQLLERAPFGLGASFEIRFAVCWSVLIATLCMEAMRVWFFALDCCGLRGYALGGMFSKDMARTCPFAFLVFPWVPRFKESAIACLQHPFHPLDLVRDLVFLAMLEIQLGALGTVYLWTLVHACANLALVLFLLWACCSYARRSASEATAPPVAAPAPSLPPATQQPSDLTAQAA